MPSLAHTPHERVRVLIADINFMSGQLIAGALRRCRDKFEVLGSTCNYAEAVHLLKKSPLKKREPVRDRPTPEPALATTEDPPSVNATLPRLDPTGPTS